MYDFGFLPESLPGLALVEGYDHKIGDIYDFNNKTNLGNSDITGCVIDLLQSQIGFISRI